ncbi:MAG: response regulator transcription factor [Defluviitaleaceae bacterium]|nr:response regulator transcription factor [Defluviitaleaceae bacterium]
MSVSVILVEDDAIIASGLTYALQQAGYLVTHAKDIKSAKAASGSYDLAILDVGLPDGSGFDLVADLKAKGASLLFLTAVDDEGNIIRAFEGGADDYVTKPFRLGELMARIKAALRRRGGQADSLSIGQVTVSPSEGKAYKDSAPLDLTALEYRLLLTFINNKNQILSREQILSQIWDSAGIFVEDNTLTVYIKRLRDKLGGAINIETIRGMGYRANDN